MDISIDEETYKEYYNLNGYYLKIALENQQIFLICYNSILLDGIKYERCINSEAINKNDKIRNLSTKELYEIIIDKLEKKNFTINEENKHINLSLYKDFSNNTNLYLPITIIKSHQYTKNEYENVLSNIILNLREENKRMKEEIDKIKNILSKMSGGNEILKVNNPPNAPVDSKDMNNKNEIKLKSNKNVNPSMIPLRNAVNKELNNNINDVPLNDIKRFSAKTEIVKKNKNNIFKNDINSSLTISTLAKLEFGFYPEVELSPNSFFKISGYGANTYNGIIRKYNEDKLKIILDYKLKKTVKTKKGNIINPNISFFGLYDGHGGNKCSVFLQEKFDSFLLESDSFPLDTLKAIDEAYIKSENEFKSIAFDQKNNILLDRSGSCSLTALILDEWCFISYLGDSRGLYSFNSGNQLYQITRDHKPNDPIEKARIEKAGGNIYKDDRIKINGKKVHVKEETLGPGVSFPYRVSPGNLAVSII